MFGVVGDDPCSNRRHFVSTNYAIGWKGNYRIEGGDCIGWIPFRAKMGMLEDRAGNLWLGSPGLGLLRFDREKQQFVHYKNNPSDLESLAEDKIRSLHCSRTVKEIHIDRTIRVAWAMTRCIVCSWITRARCGLPPTMA